MQERAGSEAGGADGVPSPIPPYAGNPTPRSPLEKPEDGHLLKCYFCKNLFVCKPRGGIIPLWCPRCIQLQANPERWN